MNILINFCQVCSHYMPMHLYTLVLFKCVNLYRYINWLDLTSGLNLCSLCTFFSGSVRSMQFSPDPAALKSILLNEGVKAGRPVGATPRNSVCPSGRGTSIYTVCSFWMYSHICAASSCLISLHHKQKHIFIYFCFQAQRVPVRKNCAEATGGAVGKMWHHISCHLMLFYSNVTQLFFYSQQ